MAPWSSALGNSLVRLARLVEKLQKNIGLRLLKITTRRARRSTSIQKTIIFNTRAGAAPTCDPTWPRPPPKKFY